LSRQSSNNSQVLHNSTGTPRTEVSSPSTPTSARGGGKNEFLPYTSFAENDKVLETSSQEIIPVRDSLVESNVTTSASKNDSVIATYSVGAVVDRTALAAMDAKNKNLEYFKKLRSVSNRNIIIIIILMLLLLLFHDIKILE
jgi:hypothetical protein